MGSIVSGIADLSMQIYRSSLFQNDRSPREALLEQTFKWPNPGNIAHGSPGKALFMLELFKCTRDESVYEDLLKYVAEIERSAAHSKTNNYSLFYGRSGLGYLYIELYKATQREEFIVKATEIVKEFFDRQSLHMRFFDNNGFANGTAGTLLFYSALQNEIDAGWLGDRIGDYIIAILDKASFTSSGIYWTGMGAGAHHFTSWANGNAGIAFSLLETAAYLNNEPLSALGHAALRREIKTNAVIHPQNNHLEPFCDGNAGYHLVRLYSTLYEDNAVYSDNWRTIADSVNRRLDKDDTDGLPTGILNGLAGWGLAFREAYSLKENYEDLDIAYKIASVLQDKYHNDRTFPEKNTDFSDGLSGIGYFLLKLVGPVDSPSLLLPRIGRIIHPKENDEEDPIASKISWRRVNTILASTNFRNTIQSLGKEFKEDLDDFFSARYLVSVQSFIEWVNELAESIEYDDPLTALRETIERESFIAGIKDKLPDYLPDDDLRVAQNISHIQELSEDEFLQLRLGISSKIAILRKEPFIDFTKPIPPELFSSLFTSYGKKSHFFRNNKFNDLETRRLGISRLFVDFFVQPAVAGNILNRFVEFIMSQDHQIIGLLQTAFKAGNKETFLFKLRQYVISTLKDLVIMDVLEVNI